MQNLRGGKNVDLCERCLYKTTFEFEHDGQRWTQNKCEKDGLQWEDVITVKCINFKERKDEVDSNN